MACMKLSKWVWRSDTAVSTCWVACLISLMNFRYDNTNCKEHTKWQTDQIYTFAVVPQATLYFAVVYYQYL